MTEVTELQTVLLWQSRTLRRTPNLMAKLYYAEHVHIAKTGVQIPTLYFYIDSNPSPN